MKNNKKYISKRKGIVSAKENACKEPAKSSAFIFLMTKFVTGHKIVVVKLPRDIPGILIKAIFIWEKMLANPLFPNTVPSMDDFKQRIDEAIKLEAAMDGGGEEITIKRNMAVSLVITDIFKLHGIVQTLVTLNSESAKEIAQSAGMDIRGFTKRGKQQWGAYYTGLTGEIELEGECVTERSAYVWQATLTPEIKKSWKDIDIEVTIKANTIVKGLIPGTRVFFRYKIVVSSGPKDWSDVLSMIII